MKNKHLTQEERDQIYDGLKKGMNFKEIGKFTGKDPSTIAKEIKKHLNVKPSTIKRTDASGNPIDLPCQNLLKPPYCCNGCERRYYKCGFDKYYYEPRLAHKQYRDLLVESRQGIALNKDDFWKTDRIVTEGLKKGQHLYQIIEANDIPYSQSSVYRHLKSGYLSCSAIDFPRVVRFRPRKKEHIESIPSALKKNRTYDCFLKYTEENNINDWVEIDTVIGTIGGKCIMTMHFTICNFMVGFLLDNKDADSVAGCFRNLKNHLAASGLNFGILCPLILTDNGSEFADIAAIEADINGEPETRLFFCEPYRSCEKPEIEKNHTLFRDIAPSGTSFEKFTQSAVDEIFSHINSVARPIYNGKSAYEMFSFIYGKRTADAFNIRYIGPTEVIQSKRLLKKLNIL